MKKLLFLLSVIALYSCARDPLDSVVRIGGTYAVEACAGYGQMTRTDISGLSVFWKGGDKIGVYAAGYQENKAFSNAGSTTFKGIFDVVGSSSPSVEYYSYYPYTDNVSGTTVTSSLSSHQSAPFDGQADFIVADVLDEKYDEEHPASLSFRFKNHLFGIVKITVTNTNALYAEETLDRITLFSSGTSLAGTFSVDVSDGAAAEAMFSGAGPSYVSMVYPTASKPLLGLNVEHTVYAVVRAIENKTIKVIVSTSGHEGSVESAAGVSFGKGVLTSIPSVDFGTLTNIKETAAYKYNCAFMGDSITQFWASSGNGGHPEFFSSNNFLGKGISGQKTWEMLARFDKDIIKNNPRAVIILAGTNNIGWYPDTCDVNVIKRHVAFMCEMADAAGIKPIVCSILPRKKYNDKVITSNALLRDYAAVKGFAYVDYYKDMSVDDVIISSYFPDGLHPNSDGFYVMEGICLPVIEEVIFR